MRALLYAALTALLLAPAPEATAQGRSGASRCPAGSSGCTVDNAGERIQERVRQGARDVMNERGVGGRGREIKRTLRDCVDCGTDAIREGVDRVSGRGSGRR
jgi:hypothetical protein